MIRGVKLENTQFDYPITITTRVEYWVDYFLGRGRPHFAKYLERSEHFIPFIQPILRQNGMPEDLVYLAMIESGFNNHAKSHAKAVGPWQFISATGKRYGLMINWWVDERRDTQKSTIAAVNYLKDLYSVFGSWELASAAYNAGEAKVARAIQRYGTKDFWVLARQRFLRQETRDYVPKIIAAALVAKNRTQFGFAPPGLKPKKDEILAGDGEVVKVEKAEHAAVRAEEEGETLASILEGQEVEAETLRAPASATSAPLARPVPTPHVSRNGEVSGTDTVEIEVQSPADLKKIADAAGLSYQTVKSLNPEMLRWCTPPHVSYYRVKLPSSVKERFLETYNHEAYPRQVKFLAYKVQNGQSLSSIARYFGISVEPMVELNGVSSRSAVRAGSRVLLPIPHDRSRSLASLDVRDTPQRRRKVRSKKQVHEKIDRKKRQSARAGADRSGT